MVGEEARRGFHEPKNTKGETSKIKTGTKGQAPLGLVDKSIADVQQMVDEFQKKAKELVETASSYAQAALWATFVCALLALAASISGGWIGAASVQRETMAINKRRVI